MTQIYLAAALTCASRMRAWAGEFSRDGFGIVSKWHSTYYIADPYAPEVRREILLANLWDLRVADIIFADTTQGVPACTFAEIGFALALGKLVVWLQPDGLRADGVMAKCIIDAHPGVHLITGTHLVLPELRKVREILLRDAG